MPPLSELWDAVRRIPYGHVASYGEVGRALHNPATGYMVGRWMAGCPSDVPWWRVVAKDGRLPLAKRSPADAVDQAQRLREEGINVEDGLVPKAVFVFASDLMSVD